MYLWYFCLWPFLIQRPNICWRQDVLSGICLVSSFWGGQETSKKVATKVKFTSVISRAMWREQKELPFSYQRCWEGGGGNRMSKPPPSHTQYCHLPYPGLRYYFLLTLAVFLVASVRRRFLFRLLLIPSKRILPKFYRPIPSSPSQDALCSIFFPLLFSIEYWFRCMDLDGDGLLSMYELEYFYTEQVTKMEALGIETMVFEDCLCQV